MLLLGKIMILQGVGHPISCLGVCYANDPKKGGYMPPAPALDLTTSLRGDFVRGLIPMSLHAQLTTPPTSRSKPAHCHNLKLALTARTPLHLGALYRTLEWLNDHPPPAPLTPPTGPNPWRRPWSPYSTSHTVKNCPLPTHHPPSPLPDKVTRKPPKRPRPPSPAGRAKARKRARQPPKPVRPLSLKRHAADPPQPEPPPSKKPLTIRDMFNPPPPPPTSPPS